jgi:hypothetical protein
MKQIDIASNHTGLILDCGVVSHMIPHVVNQIFFKLVVGGLILNLVMCMNKFLKWCRSKSRSNQITLKFLPLVTDAIITLVLNYHVLHDHASSTSHIRWTLHILVGWRTMAPHLSYKPLVLLQTTHVSSSLGLRVVFTKTIHSGRYHQPSNIPCCMDGPWSHS